MSGSRRRRSIRGGRSRICRSLRAMWSRSWPAWRATPRSWCSTRPRPRCRRGRPNGRSDCARDMAAAGALVLFISHRLHECRDVAEHYTVLRRGRAIRSAGSARRATRTIVEDMLGPQAAHALPAAAASPGAGGDPVGQRPQRGARAQRRVLRSARRRDPRARRLGGTGSVDADAGALRHQALERNGAGRRRAGANRFAARALAAGISLVPEDRPLPGIASRQIRSARTSPCRCCRG